MTQQTAMQDKGVVLVSGVGAPFGLGAAIARRFAVGGHPVAIAGRNGAKLKATHEQLLATGASVAMIVAEAAVEADMARAVTTAASLGRLEVAVHNAGSNRPAPFLDTTQESFEEHWRAHALGGFQLARAAIPELLPRGGSLFFTGARGSLRGR